MIKTGVCKWQSEQIPFYHPVLLIEFPSPCLYGHPSILKTIHGPGTKIALCRNTFDLDLGFDRFRCFLVNCVGGIHWLYTTQDRCETKEAKVRTILKNCRRLLCRATIRPPYLFPTPLWGRLSGSHSTTRNAEVPFLHINVISGSFTDVLKSLKSKVISVVNCPAL